MCSSDLDQTAPVHADGLDRRGLIGASGMEDINSSLKRMERYWTEQIRYIY